MSTIYKNSSDVPLDTIAGRLNELADAILGGRSTQANEFTMSIPAECDRDADIVIAEAAKRLGDLRDYNAQLQDEAEKLRGRIAELEADREQGGEAAEHCSWWKDMADWDGNTWEADCGACWILIDEGPLQNEMNYCPKCGRKLSQLPPEKESE